MKHAATGGADAWPRASYLNIWVCDLNPGLLGYAQFPGGPADRDGVVVDFAAFGRTGSVSPPYHRGRVATHEIGHWLNLRHLWGDQQPNCGTDLVADTPPANVPHWGCLLTAVSCGGLNMVQNYMDYSDDACKNLFTTGQKARMRALFASGGARASLLASAGCTPGMSASVYVNGASSGPELGTPANPFRTVGAALPLVLPGGQILIAPGHYPETVAIQSDVNLVAFPPGLVRLGP